MAVFNRCYKGFYLAEIALRIDLVVRKYGSKVLRQAKRHSRAVTGIKVFDGFVMLVDFLVWDTEDGGVLWFEGQQLHLRETVDSF